MLYSGSECVQGRKPFLWKLLSLRLNMLQCLQGMGLTLSGVGETVLCSIEGYTCFQLHSVFNPCAGGKTLLFYL